MTRKKGVFMAFLAIALLSVLLFGCTIINKPSAVPAADESRPQSSENLPQAQVSPPVPTQTCDDSDDGGNNPYRQGTLRLAYGETVSQFTDRCANADYLTEYYCDGKEYRFYSKLCTYGCSEGACRQGPAQSPMVEQPAPVPFPPSEEPKGGATPECFNGFRDLEETDMDCGGPNCKPCGYGKHCGARRDCVAPLACNQRSFLCLNTAY